MNIFNTPLPGVVLITPDSFEDDRGFFLETYRNKHYAQITKIQHFVQDNHSRSKRNVLRGLHYQLHDPQAKLVSVTRGKVFDVAVDIRKNSPHFGQWFGTILDDIKHQQLFIPAGFAHGFCVLSEEADFTYKCSTEYNPDADYGVLWNDPSINIDWPIESADLSNKDSQLPLLANIPENQLPDYQELS